MDVGVEKNPLGSDEINDFFPREIFASEGADDAYDFFSESDIDIVETIQERLNHIKKMVRLGEKLTKYLQKQPTT